ncbi:MAG TPA: S53 family peptidase [Terriglobales bacterium]|nr:S53 family peptidase [Terriglobales bacterium]
MKRLIAVCRFMGVAIVGVAVLAALAASPAAAQQRVEGVFNGHRIIYPASSIPQAGHHHTNYFFVDSDKPQGGPGSGVETPGSLACVYQLVTQTSGCNPATATTLPTGGWGAIAIVDAGYYPTAATDLAQFSTYYGIPQADFEQVWPGKKQPEVESDWEVEEALDIEWAHAMAPQAKLYLVVSKLCNVGTCATDPFWNAVSLATKLVKEAGGGVVSMSWGDAEWSTESTQDKLFKNKHVVYFASSGDSGLNHSIYPSSSPYVVSVGGTYFNRDTKGNFISEQWYTNGGGGDISPYEPRPAYQNGVQSIVGTQRGYPDISSDFCCAGIVVEGGWYSVGGTSWSSPTMAGIVNAAGNKAKGSLAELNMIYGELANQSEYSADFNDITSGGSLCVAGFDKCTGIGSPKTYVGK